MIMVVVSVLFVIRHFEAHKACKSINAAAHMMLAGVTGTAISRYYYDRSRVPGTATAAPLLLTTIRSSQ